MPRVQALNLPNHCSVIHSSNSCYAVVMKSLIVCVQLAQLIVNAGGVAAMVDYVSDTCGNVRLPGIMMLGYVAAHSENLAMAVIVSKVYSALSFLSNT